MEQQIAGAGNFCNWVTPPLQYLDKKCATQEQFLDYNEIGHD